jgi:hypothetical protein
VPVGAVDVLTSGAEARPTRPTARRLAVAAVALVVLAGFAVDRHVRQAEFEALMAQAAAGQAAIAYADRRVGATVQYASPVLGSPQTSPLLRADLQRLVQAEAGSQAAVLRDRHVAGARIDIWPWHEEQRDAQRAYAVYLAARADYLEEVSADFGVLYGRPPELADRLMDAARAYDRAALRRSDALAARQLLLGRVRGQLSP